MIRKLLRSSMGHAGEFAWKAGLVPSGVRVLLLHDIPESCDRSLAELLDRLGERVCFVDPLRLDEALSAATAKPGVLVTFDDGFVSNARVAQMVLEPRGIRAIFFVPSGFVDARDDAESALFVAERIFPAHSSRYCTNHSAMTWMQLKNLVQVGHIIGAHTRTHSRLSTLGDAQAKRDEICSDADRIEQMTGVRVEHFAFPFGNLSSIDSESMAIARARFRWVHSGLRGSNFGITPRWAIARDAVSCHDPHGFAIAAMLGWFDSAYSRDRLSLEAL